MRTALCVVAVTVLALLARADDRPTPEAAKARAVAEIAIAKATQSVKAACPCGPECDCPVCDCGTEAVLAKAHATALVIEAKHHARQTIEPKLFVPAPPVVRAPGNSVRVPEPLPQPTCRLVWNPQTRSWVQTCTPR